MPFMWHKAMVFLACGLAAFSFIGVVWMLAQSTFSRGHLVWDEAVEAKQQKQRKDLVETVVMLYLGYMLFRVVRSFF